MVPALNAPREPDHRQARHSSKVSPHAHSFSIAPPRLVRVVGFSNLDRYLVPAFDGLVEPADVLVGVHDLAHVKEQVLAVASNSSTTLHYRPARGTGRPALDEVGRSDNDETKSASRPSRTVLVADTCAE
jgi:hypothetical protein